MNFYAILLELSVSLEKHNVMQSVRLFLNILINEMDNQLFCSLLEWRCLKAHGLSWFEVDIALLIVKKVSN